jgi:hypothetical protein
MEQARSVADKLRERIELDTGVTLERDAVQILQQPNLSRIIHGVYRDDLSRPPFGEQRGNNGFIVPTS